MSCVEAWTSPFLLSGKRAVSPPVELRQGIQDFLELPQGSRISRSVVRGNSGFHSRAAGESGLILGRWGTYCPFHLRQVTRGSSRVVMGIRGYV